MKGINTGGIEKGRKRLNDFHFMAKAAISKTIRLRPEALNRERDGRGGGKGTWDNVRSTDAHA